MLHYFEITLLNLAVELPIAVTLLWLMGVGIVRGMLVVTAINLAIHPLFILSLSLMPGSLTLNLTGLEILVWLTEASVYRLTLKVDKYRALTIAFCANAASLIAGLLL